jgi:hypothetical protein
MKTFFMRIHKVFVFGFLLVVTLQACGKKRNALSDVIEDLEEVSSNFSPESVQLSTSESSLQAQDEEFCAGYESAGNFILFACQPRFLQAYIGTGKTFFNVMIEFVKSWGEGLGKLKDGASGEVTIGSDQVLSYKKTNDRDLEILLKVSSSQAVFAYGSVNGNTSRLQLNFEALPAASNSAGTRGQLQIDLEFQEATKWTMNLLVQNQPCKDADPQGPRALSLQLTKAGNLGLGNAAMHNPIWARQFVTPTSVPTCSTAAADNISMNLFHGFVGSNNATKANVHMAKNTSTAWGADNELRDFCATYGVSGCGTALDSYANPFCSLGDTALWNNTCSAADAEVSSTAFLGVDSFVRPDNIATSAVTLPTSFTR